MNRRPAIVLALLAIVSGAAAAQPAIRVTVDGAVQQPGPQQWPARARLAEATLAARPDADAWPTGASLQRHAARQEQARMKAGLAFDLQVLQRRSDDPALRAVAGRLAAWLDTLPVTGRVRAELEPRRTEVNPSANLPLADGDRIHYPQRPTTVRVVGAVAAPCTLAHVALRDALEYRNACPVASADRDWLFVIQPDGEVQRLGIAAWNRSPAHPLAPGATLYVPLPERALRDVDTEFNSAFADFIATQAVDGMRMGAIGVTP